MSANYQPTIQTIVPWRASRFEDNIQRKRVSHPGQVRRSQRKRELQGQRAAADLAEATLVGITVDELRRQRFETARPFMDAFRIPMHGGTGTYEPPPQSYYH